MRNAVAVFAEVAVATGVTAHLPVEMAVLPAVALLPRATAGSTEYIANVNAITATAGMVDRRTRSPVMRWRWLRHAGFR